MTTPDTSAERLSSLTKRYGLSVLLVLSALLVTLLARPETLVGPLFLLAVILSAWLGGIGPGLVAAVAATLSIGYVVLTPRYTFRFNPAELPELLAFLVSALLISVWSNVRNRTERLLRQTRAELEDRAQERTSELSQRNEQLRIQVGEGQRVAADLRESEERFRVLSESSLTGIYLIQESRFRYVNPAMGRMFGYTVDEVLDRLGPLDLVHPDDRPLVGDNIRRRLDGEVEAIRYAFRGLRKDGSAFAVEVHDRRIHHGGNIGVLGTLVDITERERAELERQAHLSFLEGMDRVNQAMQGTNDLEQMTSDVLEAVLSIFACDRAWLVHPCDPLAPTWRVVMEHTRAEFPGAFALGVALPVTPEVATVFEAAKRSGGAVRFDPGSDHRLPVQLAERFTIRSMIAMVVSPKMGEPYLFGLHQCSSPRVWAPTEERLFREIGRRLADALTSVLIFRSLRESERRLDEAQRTAQVGYWDRDLAAGRMTLSVEGGRIFGLQPEERVVDLAVWQERWQAFIHPEDRPRALQAVAAALAGGPRYDVEFRIIRRNGEVRVVHSQGDVITDASGRPCRMFGTMQDITERKRAEAELRASEERFRTLVQFSFDVYWETDAQHRFTRQEFAEGLADAPAPGSEIGKTRWEVPYLEPDEEAWRQHRAALDAHLPFRDFELARPTPEGGKRYVSVSGLPVFDAMGHFIGYRGVGRHITDRKRAEQALRQSQAYLAEAQRLSHTGSWALDVASDKYISVSEEGFRIFGFDAQEGLPTREAVSRRILPEDRDRVKRGFETSLRGRVDTSSEFRIALPSGTVRHIQAIQHPVLNDAGDVVELVGTVIDVTERKLAEQRLLAQHTVAQILAEAATVEEATPKILQAVCDCLAWDVGVLWRPDRGAGVLRCAEIWHKAALTIPQFLAINRATAFRPGEALPGQVWASRAPAAIPDVVQDAGMRRGPIADYEDLHGALAFPILLAGEVLGVLEFFSREVLHPNQDLLRTTGTIGSQIGQFSERKRAERALYEAQANLAHVTRVTTLGELAASIAHEVNQPLAAMVADAKASLNWLAKVNPDLDLVREVLANIVEDGHRAAEVIQRIRQLAKKSAGLEKVRLDVNELIRDVLPLVRGEVLRHRVSLRLELTSAPPPVLADRVQLHQVLINLVMNGIEAMASVHDRPRELVLRSQAHDGEGVHVMVEDVGIGIDPETADRMFTAFFTTKPGGMGMGLSITRSIIEAHGGRIWATANAQHGTTFHLVLPRMR